MLLSAFCLYRNHLQAPDEVVARHFPRYRYGLRRGRPAACVPYPASPAEVRGSGLKAQRRDWTSGTPHGPTAGAGFLVSGSAIRIRFRGDDEMRAYSKKDVDKKALKGAKIAV